LIYWNCMIMHGLANFNVVWNVIYQFGTTAVLKCCIKDLKP